MAIQVKTRKILWSKAGNRCAICKKTLVQRITTIDSDFVVGEECHIISSKDKGPRGRILKLDDFDVYENLILLCANDHKLIDDFPETFTKGLITMLKENHEKWIEDTIDKELSDFWKRLNNIVELEEISNSHVLDNIIGNSHFYLFDSSSVLDDQILVEINGLFDSLKDISDLYQDIDLSSRASYLVEIIKSFEQFRSKGIRFFGSLIIKNIKITNSSEQPYRISLVVAHFNQESWDLQNGKLRVRLPDEIIPSF